MSALYIGLAFACFVGGCMVGAFVVLRWRTIECPHCGERTGRDRLSCAHCGRRAGAYRKLYSQH